MINFDDVTKENVKEHNANSPQIPDHPYRILIIGDSISGKTSSLFNLLSYQPDIDKIYVVVITAAQLHSTKPEIRFCTGSSPARGVSEIHNGEDLWQWSRLEISLNAFRRSTIPQKRFIIIIIIIIIIVVIC